MCSRGLAAAVLMGTAFVCAPWALYQWMELLTALGGGEVACAVSETFDCSKVWSAPLAKSLHRLTGLPLAGWGLVWAFAAFVAAAWVALSAGPDRAAAPAAVWATRWVALGGVLSSVGLFALSAALGSFCPTCLATYGLVAVYAGVAVFGLSAPWPRGVRQAGLLPVAVAVVAGWLALLWPGLRTPVEAPAAVEVTGPERAPDAASGPVAQVVAQLPPPARAELKRVLETIRTSTAAVPEPRRLRGPAEAPVRITDFSDLRCGHCRTLARALSALDEAYPGRFSEDARYYPLSSTCNPEVPAELQDPTGTRCHAAKTLLCLEAHPRYFALREAMFEAQAELTRARVDELAERFVGASALAACAGSPEVADKLRTDIALAERYAIRGTPLLLLNGHEVPPFPPLVYALVLAGADPDHPAFADL